ncbi:hypothetical protein ACFLRF_02940 [Candidatus Altiarchaeota archaeon]
MKADTIISVILLIAILYAGYFLIGLVRPDVKGMGQAIEDGRIEKPHTPNTLPKFLTEYLESLNSTLKKEAPTTTLAFEGEHASTTLAPGQTTTTIHEDGPSSSTMDLDLSEHSPEDEDMQDYTITSCDGNTITYVTGTSDCGSDYICDPSKVGKTYPDIEVMQYDACIGRVYADPDPQFLETCQERGDVKMRELCYINKAAEHKNLGMCDLITQPTYTDMCIAQVAVSAVDPGLCYKVLDRTLMKECLKAVKIIRYSK